MSEANRDYPPERQLPGMVARLAAEGDWSAMSAAANASPNHVASLARWVSKAREANPALDDDQAYRLGQMLKKQHFIKMGKLSAESRRLAREARALLPDGDDIPVPLRSAAELPDDGYDDGRPRDPEVRAMEDINDALAVLDAAAIGRVLRWTWDRYGSDDD